LESLPAWCLEKHRELQLCSHQALEHQLPQHHAELFAPNASSDQEGAFSLVQTHAEALKKAIAQDSTIGSGRALK
jgi:hypothetical protein